MVHKNSLNYFLCLAYLSSLTVLAKQSERINVGITFTKVATNKNLQEKFELCVSSLLQYAKVDINFYIIGDMQSQLIARKIFAKIGKVNIKYDLKSVDADNLAKQMHKLVSKMQSHFSSSPSSYYGDSLFFLSIGLFKVFDPNVKRIILLDADLKFQQDIGQLYNLFPQFTQSKYQVVIYLER